MMTIDDLKAQRAALPDLLTLPPTAHAEVWERRQTLDKRINVAGTATDSLSEVDPLIERLEKEKFDLDAIRRELCDELTLASTMPRGRAMMDPLRGLKISILIVDGRFDLMNEAIPTPLPLFSKLAERNYVPPAHAPWNPMAGLFGSLPTIELRLAQLAKRRAEAQAQRDSALRDPVAAT
jgi:hypothetical protein